MTAFTQGTVYSSQQVSKPENVESFIYELAPTDTPLLTRLGLDSLRETCVQPTFIYQDMEHRYNVSTLSSAISSTSATTVAITDANMSQNDIIQIETELIKLGVPNSTNTSFTGCTRGVGSTTAATHASGQQVVSIGRMNVQGAASGGSDGNIMPSRVTNYTTIVEREVSVSNTADATARHGRTGSEYDYQAAYHNQMCFKQLEGRVLWGYSQAAATNATAGGMDGIWQRINSASSTSTSSLDLTLNHIRPAVRTTNQYGSGNDLLLLCPLYTKDVIDSWGQTYVRHDVPVGSQVMGMALGASVDMLHVGGKRIHLVPYPSLETEAFLLDVGFLGVGPLNGGKSRAFSHTFEGVSGDRIKGFFVGEYTMEVPCVHAHHVFYGLKSS